MSDAVYADAGVSGASCFEMSTRAGVPVLGSAEFSGWSRRRFLGVLGALAGGTLAGCTTARGGDRQAFEAASSHGTDKPGYLGGAAGPGYTPQAPFAVTAQSVLSEDYFLVQNHQIDPAKDTVIAYSRADGQVEAMVLQDGVVKQIYRDPTQPGGWAVYALPDAEGVTSMVAGISAPVVVNKQAAPALKVFYVKAATPDKLTVAVETTTPSRGSSPGFTTATVAWHAQAGPLQIALNADNSLLVAAMVPPSVLYKPATDARLYYYTDANTIDHDTTAPTPTSWGYLTGFDYVPKANGASWAAMVARAWNDNNEPTIYLYLPGASQFAAKGVSPSVVVLSTSLQSGQRTGTVLTDAAPRLGAPPFPASAPQAQSQVVAIDFLTSLGSTLMPTALAWTKTTAGYSPRLWALSFDILGSGDKWSWTELVLPSGATNGLNPIAVSTALTPSPDPIDKTVGATSLLDVFVLAANTLHVFRQAPQGDAYKNAAQPLYCPAIALQPAVAVMTSQAAVSDGNELLLVGTDGALQTLEKDPVSGRWTDTALHLPADELQQNPSYRVALSLADTAWNAAVTDHPLTITASSPATAIVEGDTANNPKTVLLGQDPVTVITDRDGQVILALLADGLSAPTLTITGASLSDSVTVYPSGAINTYMTGDTTTKLNYLDPLSPGTLQGAKTPPSNGQPAVTVAPGATNGKDAADAVDNMNAAAVQAQQGVKLGKVAATIGRPDGRSSHRRRNGVGATLGAHALISDIDHWSHDALHGIKKGAARVSKVTHDLEHDTFVIAADFKGWVDNAVSVVVHSIEDAAHVIHAEFNRLAAEIVHAVKWLEAEVIGTFKDSKLVSDKFDQWITDFTGFAATPLATEETKILGWLNKEQSTITNRFTALTGYQNNVTLATMAQNSPGPLGARRRPSHHPKPTPTPTRHSTLYADADEQTRTPHHDWFYNKIKHELASSHLTLNLANTPDLTTQLINFRDTLRVHTKEFQDKYHTKFWMGFINDVVHHPAEVNDIVVHDLLQAILGLLDEAFGYVENIVAQTLDLLQGIVESIPHMLNDTTLKNLPILGGLMKLIGLGDVTIGRVVNLIFAFPATVTYKIARGATARPFTSKTLSHRSGRHRSQQVGDAAGDLQITAASVMGTWAIFDSISATFSAADEEGALLFTGIDIAAPLIVTVLTTPATKDGEPFFAPPVSGDVADVLGFMAWIFGAWPAFDAATLLFSAKVLSQASERDELEQLTLWNESCFGIVTLVFGMVANSEKAAPKGADYAGAVLNNMPTIAAAGVTKVLDEATEGTSIVAALALILICGGTGAIVYGVDG